VAQSTHAAVGTTHSVGLGQWLRSILFTIYFFLSTLFYSCIIVLFFWLPYRCRYPIAAHWACSVLWMLKHLCRLDYAVEGRERLPPANHISMWKHSSSWETVAQMAIFPPQAWVLKRELLWIPFVGWAIKLMRPIAIDRGSGHVSIKQVIEQGQERLASGMWILVFPEGTRVPAGATRKYGLSGALLATQTHRLIVPVAHNSGDFWPRRGLLKKPGTIRVVIGPPIDPAGLEPRQLNERVQTWIETTIADLRRS
jgi:1-acyl-sn-glycerol-3-phosphate acyltransferase